MAATLPQFTAAIDTLFTQTWQEMRAEATDQILNATVLTALFKQKGLFKPQVGGSKIERTVRYGIGSYQPIDKGGTLPMGEVETHTAAFWGFRNVVSHVQRDKFSDTAQRGKYAIRSYVQDRTEAAMDALKQGYEKDMFAAADTNEGTTTPAGSRKMQSVNDITVPYASRATGTYGGIARSNSWWQCKYKQWTSPIAVNQVSDMKNFYNTVSDNRITPDIILTTQALYENYEDFGLDAVQVMANQKLLDLGFTTLKFKGADMTWTPDVTAGNMHFLHSNDIEVVYDPGMWFDMDEWKQVPNQTERVAHIFCRCNMICKSLRNQGLLYQ